MLAAKTHILAALGTAVDRLVAEATLAPGTPRPTLSLESPRQASHGDYACTAAMALARLLKSPPRQVAERLVAALQASPTVADCVEAIEIAGPGFINLRLTPAARQAIVSDVLAAGERYGVADTDTETSGAAPVLVEFVSANPTGPLHVGHGRQAALGDAICRLFATQGLRVTREFYYNDAGVQIATLAQSVHARLHGLAPGDPGWPEPAYNGDYIRDIADAYRDRQSVQADDRAFTASGDTDDVANIRDFAVAYLRHEQDLDLAAFGVRFDQHYLESSLYSSGRVASAVQRLVESGHTYEADGALWLRSTAFGDDKDRVMRKSDGTYTYFVPDVAYHITKWERGYHRAIDIQGTDHHGTIARVRAGLQAAGVGIPPGYPEYTLNKMVAVMRGGVEVKLSKRAGSYVTLRDLIDWTSRDAVRFFLISRKADSEFVFDVDLARQRNDENPVFYVQYAHARICSVLRQHAAQHGALAGGLPPPTAALLARLTAPTEAALMRKLADYPALLADAAATLSPHDVTFYLRELSAAFHSYYAAERVLQDDAELADARIALLAATRQVLANALGVLGVTAPESM